MNLATGFRIELPQPSFKRSHQPILTVVGTHLVVHGGEYVGEGFATEEALKLDDFVNTGWQARTVGDVSRVDSPAVLVSAKFFPDCVCEQ